MWKWYEKLRNLPRVMYPELMNLPEDVRRQLRKSGTGHPQIFPWRDCGVIILMMLVLFGVLYYSNVYYPRGGMLENVINSLCVIWCLIIYAKIILLVKHVHKRWLHGELNRLRVRPRRCLRCGYDLRGTPDESTNCPECGAEIAAVTHEAHDVVDAE